MTLLILSVQYGRVINQQLLKQAEERLGQAPVAYAWVVAGSLAKSEQIIHSDQDNLLIINDDFQSKIQADFFVKLAKYVRDGLNTCGYVYCPEEVMAPTFICGNLILISGI